MACSDSDVLLYPVTNVVLVTTEGLVLPGQKLVMYGSAASSRVTLTACEHGLFVGGIGCLWR
jgi:hypothetical protein